MTNYYIEKDNKIIFVDTDLQRLKSTIAFGEYSNLEIKQTDRPIVNFQFADTDEYITEQLEAKKTEKLAENEYKRNVEYIPTSLGLLKTLTPLGDLKTAMPLYKELVNAQGGLPANMVRFCDTDGNITLNEAMTVEEFNAIIVAISMAYIQIDVKSSTYTQAIINATTLEELEAIVIDYEV